MKKGLSLCLALLLMLSMSVFSVSAEEATEETTIAVTANEKTTIEFEEHTENFSVGVSQKTAGGLSGVSMDIATLTDPVTFTIQIDVEKTGVYDFSYGRLSGKRL